MFCVCFRCGKIHLRQEKTEGQKETDGCRKDSVVVSSFVEIKITNYDKTEEKCLKTNTKYNWIPGTNKINI